MHTPILHLIVCVFVHLLDFQVGTSWAGWLCRRPANDITQWRLIVYSVRFDLYCVARTCNNTLRARESFCLGVCVFVLLLYCLFLARKIRQETYLQMNEWNIVSYFPICTKQKCEKSSKFVFNSLLRSSLVLHRLIHTQATNWWLAAVVCALCFTLHCQYIRVSARTACWLTDWSIEFSAFVNWLLYASVRVRFALMCDVPSILVYIFFIFHFFSIPSFVWCILHIHGIHNLATQTVQAQIDHTPTYDTHSHSHSYMTPHEMKSEQHFDQSASISALILGSRSILLATSYFTSRSSRKTAFNKWFASVALHLLFNFNHYKCYKIVFFFRFTGKAYFFSLLNDEWCGKKAFKYYSMNAIYLYFSIFHFADIRVDDP